jgi:hypothetical protein
MDTTQPSRTLRTAIAGLMALAAVALAVASLLHFGVAVPLGGSTFGDPYRNAAIPEAIIAVVVAIGVTGIAARLPIAWPLAVGTTAFAVLGVLVGLSFTLPTGMVGDITYHLSLLALLLVIAFLLLVPRGRRALEMPRQ